MTPRELAYLLQFKTGVTVRFTPAESNTIRNNLTNEGLIEGAHEEGKGRLTERGKVHLAALLEAPLPINAWVSPFSNHQE